MALVLVGLVVCAGGVLLWFKVLRDHVVPKNFGVVMEGRIYRSGRLTPRTLRRMRDMRGVRTVIDLGAYWPGSREESVMVRAASELGVTRISVRGLRGDGRGNANAYLEVVRAMTEEGRGPMVVHCAAGADRTGAAVVLYRHIVQGWDLDKAIEEATRFRHDPKKNEAMRAYVMEHAPKIRSAFVRGGTIEGHDAAEIAVLPPRNA